MNKRILLSAMSIVTSLTLVGGAAFAAFSTTANMNGSTFSSGNANLTLAKPSGADPSIPGSFSGTVSGFDVTHIAPGFNQQFNFWMKNASSSDITLDTNTVLTQTTGETQDPELLNALMVQFVCEGSPATPNKTVQTWTTNGVEDLGSIPAGQIKKCSMVVSLPSTADNSVSGKTLTFDGVFNGVEHTL
jgi:hypothetical protein